MSSDLRKSVLAKTDSVSSGPAHERAFDSPPNDDLSLAPRVPRIERMPEGIEVVERDMGSAVAQWILMVHCECGRRWFELEFVDTATCPRCGSFVMVELDGVTPVR